MSIFSEWKHPLILFKFSVDDFGQFPLYAEVVDLSWHPPDFDAILGYLRQTRVIAATVGPDPIVCPLCGTALEPHGVSAQQSDGRWWWFTTLSHYVEFHHVRLPDRMVEHLRTNRYQPPTASSTSRVNPFKGAE